MNSDFRVGDWRVRRQLNALESPDGEVVRLEPKAVAVLEMLAARAGEVLSKEELLDGVWAGTFVSDDVLANVIWGLRRHLRDDARDPTFIQTIPKRGYRLIAPVAPLDEAADDPDAAIPAGSRAHRRSASILAGALAVTALGAIWLWPRAADPDPADAIRSVVVLPLASLAPEGDDEYFADGMTEALITDLARIDDLEVISRTSAMPYRNTTKTVPEIARELGVTGVLEGAVLRDGDRVRITVQLIHAPTDRHVWAESYEGSLEDVLGLQRQVARAVARSIDLRIRDEETAPRSPDRPVSPRATDAYFKGLYHSSRAGLEHLMQARDAFQEAIRLEPEYAPARAALAGVYQTLAFNRIIPAEVAHREALAATQRALELDPDLPDAWVARAYSLAAHDWDWQGAGDAFRRAIELNPSHASAHSGYGLLLASAGRFDEGLAELEAARSHDPLTLAHRSNEAYVLYLARRYDEAVAGYREVLELAPESLQALHELAAVYIQLGRTEEARALLNRVAELAPDHTRPQAMLAYLDAVSGREARARDQLRKLLAAVDEQNVPSIHVAYVYLGLGELDTACAWVGRALEERSPRAVELATDPLYDAARSRPGCAALLERMGLPGTAHASR